MRKIRKQLDATVDLAETKNANFSKMPIFQSRISSAKNNPLMVFQISGAHYSLEMLADSDYDVISLDWTIVLTF